MQQRLQPRRQRDEDAEAEEREAAERAHRREPPERARGAALDRDVLADLGRSVACMSGAAQGDPQRERRDHRKHGLDDQQALELPVPAERRSEQERQRHPHEVAGRPHGDPGGALVGSEILACELADRAENDRLSDRHQHLAGHRPCERLTAQAHEATERDERCAAGQGRSKPAVEQHPGGNREHDIQQGKISASQPTALTETP